MNRTLSQGDIVQTAEPQTVRVAVGRPLEKDRTDLGINGAAHYKSYKSSPTGRFLGNVGQCCALRSALSPCALPPPPGPSLSALQPTRISTRRQGRWAPGPCGLGRISKRLCGLDTPTAPALHFLRIETRPMQAPIKPVNVTMTFETRSNCDNRASRRFFLSSRIKSRRCETPSVVRNFCSPGI